VRVNLTALVSFFILTLFSNIISGQNEDLDLTSITKARSMAEGDLVKVRGVITVPSGIFSSSIPFGYAIQGKGAGIYVVDTIGPIDREFSIGEEVEVIGRRSSAYGLSTIQEYQVRTTGVERLVVPKKVLTGQINESTEGMIISTSGKITKTKNDAPYGYKVFINDGSGEVDIYINSSTGLLIDTSNWKVGATIEVTGFSSQYNTEYECDPRNKTDIRIIED